LKKAFLSPLSHSAHDGSPSGALQVSAAKEAKGLSGPKFLRTWPAIRTKGTQRPRRRKPAVICV
jgi:hypothetical protein